MLIASLLGCLLGVTRQEPILGPFHGLLHARVQMNEGLSLDADELPSLPGVDLGVGDEVLDSQDGQEEPGIDEQFQAS